ncbi:hypothetical protein AB0C31_44920, partial [Actinoplanes philippinensis]
MRISTRGLVLTVGAVTVLGIAGLSANAFADDSAPAPSKPATTPIAETPAPSKPATSPIAETPAPTASTRATSPIATPAPSQPATARCGPPPTLARKAPHP